jgi:amino acid transporter
MMAGALVSSLALYNSYLASSARTTLVMGQAGLLPRVFARIHPRFGTPHAAIIIAAVAHALLAIHSFETLLVIDVFLFVLNYLLVFITCVILRVREPDLPRPFRIPVGTAGLIAVAAVPVVVGLLALVANGRETLIFGSLLAATGPLAYVLVRPLGRR